MLPNDLHVYFDYADSFERELWIMVGPEIYHLLPKPRVYEYFSGLQEHKKMF